MREEFDYVVARGTSRFISEAIKELKSEVLGFTENGYIPIGGVSMTAEYGCYTAAQAMIKEAVTYD